jgi:DNA repair protein RadC
MKDVPPISIIPPMPIIATDHGAREAGHAGIGAWPTRDRPRERLLRCGAGALSDAELVAIFLRVGVRGLNAVDLARTLLIRFGSLRGLLEAPSGDMRAVHGVGPAKMAQFYAAAEMARRLLAEKSRDHPVLGSSAVVQDYLKLMIGTRPYEVFVCLFLDVRNRLIHAEETSRGTLTQATVYPREIVRQALSLNAAALIVAHNHPSGSVQPSAADRRLTRILCDALALIDVKLLDHFIVASNTTFSFAERGWLGGDTSAALARDVKTV